MHDAAGRAEHAQLRPAHAGQAAAAAAAAAGTPSRHRNDAPLPPLPPSAAASPASAHMSQQRSAGASTAASAHASRLHAYTSLLSASNLLPGHTIADLYSLRHLAIQGGVPDQPSWLRPQAWRVLLGYLPPEKREWSKTLAARRHEYAQFLVDFLRPLSAPAAAPSSGASPAPSERDVLLDQLYKDLVRSRKNGFAFYHGDVHFATAADPARSDDQTRVDALQARQALLHRLRSLNHDYAAVTSAELGQTPAFPPEASTSAGPSTSSAMPAPPTILLPDPELSSVPSATGIPPPDPPVQPGFESLFDPAQHSSTPAGDAPAPFAADAVALPPPTAMSELENLASVLDHDELVSNTGALQLDVFSSNSGPTTPPVAAASQMAEGQPTSPVAQLATSTATSFASVVENVMDIYQNLANGPTASSEQAMSPTAAGGPEANGELAGADIPTPQQAMLEARRAHQDEIQESQTDEHENFLSSSLNQPGSRLSSARSDGSGSASRTPTANHVALPPAHAVEGYASSSAAGVISSGSGTERLSPSLLFPPQGDTSGAPILRDRRWHAILRILYVYALLNPSVGYIQGLNEVAFVIYWVMSHARSSASAAINNRSPQGSSSVPLPLRAGTPTTPRQNPLSPSALVPSAGGEETAAPSEGSVFLTPTAGSSAHASTSSLLSSNPALEDFHSGADSAVDGDGSTSADELDLEADAFWCFSLLVGSVRELYEFDGIDHAAAGLRVRNQMGAAAAARRGNGADALGWSRAESGMAGALRRMSLRLRWVDEPLWGVLRRASLDPRLPYYSFRWLACLLSNELALPSVVRLWDALLAEQDAGLGTNSSSSVSASSSADTSTGLAESPKVEFLIDICAALLVRLREPLMRSPPRASRRTRARRQRTIRRRTTTGSSAGSGRRVEESDSDIPYSQDEDEDEEDGHAPGDAAYDAHDFAQDDFAYKMHILQTFPDTLDLDVDVGPLLEQAYLFRQRRLAADLTGDGPPTYDDEDMDDGMRAGLGAAPTLQSLGERASNAWKGFGMGRAPAPSAAARSPTSGTAGGWFGSIGTRFASAPTPSPASAADAERGEGAAPGTRTLGGSLQRYAEALSSSDAAANLSKASTNLTARALAVSASWNQRAQNQDSAQGPEVQSISSPLSPDGAARAGTVGASPSSFFAKARSVSASYMGNLTMSSATNAGRSSVSGRSGGEESDSSFNGGVHPRRWSRVPIPNFPLPDPNDSDGRRSSNGGPGRMMSYGVGHARLGSEFSTRPQSPEGSEAGSESSSGRRMLPSLRMAAKLGLLPGSSSTTSSPGGGVGPKPLKLSGSARPAREQRDHHGTDTGSDLEMSRRMSNGPMAGQSPASSPRESISSSTRGSGYTRAGVYYPSSARRGHSHAHGQSLSRADSESGGEHQTISGPPSESGSGPMSRRSSLTRASTMTAASNATAFSGGDGPGATIPVSKFVRAQARGYEEGSPTIPEHPDHNTTGEAAAPTAPPSSWKRPIASSSDVPLVRNVDVSLRSRPRRQRQDTASSLESNPATPVDPRRPSAPFSGDGDGDTSNASVDGSGEPVRYQLTDGPVAVLDRSSDTVVGEAQADPASVSSTPATSSRAKFRSRMGSTRSLGSAGTNSKRSSMRSLEDSNAGGGVMYASAAEVLGEVGPTLEERDEEGHDENGKDDVALPYTAPAISTPTETTQPLRRRASPTKLLRIDPQAASSNGKLGVANGGGPYSGLAPSPLPSPGPEAGMFVSADSLLAELGAELEGLSSSSSSVPVQDTNGNTGFTFPPNKAAAGSSSSGSRRRLGQRSGDLAGTDWALTSSPQSSVDSSDQQQQARRHGKKLSEVAVPQGTMAAIGNAFAQLD